MASRAAPAERARPVEKTVENGKREPPRRRGVRYAFGNPGFHYGSGYDIYRMKTGE